MKPLNYLMVLALALISSAFSVEGTWIIDAESRLTIQGSTNVNEFTCKIESCTGTDTLQYVENNSTRQLRFTRSTMIVPIRSFDCGAKPISKDFWNTLKSESHPNLEIRFISLESLHFKKNSYIKGIVDITLAGVTARYAVCYAVQIKDNSAVLLKGAHSVNFADFGLEAPRKMRGLIKVKEALNVEFNLILREI